MKLMSTLQPLKELLGQLTATSPKLPETMPMPPGVERRTVDMMATFASGESGTMLQRQHARRVEAVKRQENDLPVYAEEQGRMALVGQGRINGVPVEARLSDEHNRELLPARSSRWLWSAEPEAEAKAAFAPDTSLPPNARATPVLLHVSDSGEPVSATAVAEATKRYGIARRALQKVQLALGMAAKALGLLVVSERRRRGLPSLANLVRIVSAEWLTWLRRETNGQKKTTTHPDVSKQGQPAGFGASFQRYFRHYDTPSTPAASPSSGSGTATPEQTPGNTRRAGAPRSRPVEAAGREST
jgi:hypothetical protein